MTPAYDLNPSSSSSSSTFPFVELKEDQLLQFFSPSHQASSSFSCPIFFKVAQDQRGSQAIEPQQHQHKADKYTLHEGLSDREVLPSSSLMTTVLDDHNSTNDGHKLPNYYKLEDENEKDRDNVSAKWMSSKMRLMQKMMDSSRAETDKQERIVHKFHDHQNNNETAHQYHNNSSNIIRVCADCHTTKTPLWRSGPQGPKSLCNACGIRQRKARRAMAAAAAAAAGNGTIRLATNATTTARSTKMQSKEKKSRKSYITQYKKQLKLHEYPQSDQKKLSFEDFALSLIKNSAFGGVFPKDEEEAAVLLMALSCGLIHS